MLSKDQCTAQHRVCAINISCFMLISAHIQLSTHRQVFVRSQLSAQHNGSSKDTDKKPRLLPWGSSQDDGEDEQTI